MKDRIRLIKKGPSQKRLLCQRQWLFGLSLLLWLCCVMRGQAQYRFDSWTTDHGLPQNSITAITQTRDGYLWLATFGGLARFDGVHFTIFERANSQLPSNRLTTLFEDHEGVLWIGTEDSGLAQYRNGVFRSFLTTAQGLPHNQIRQVFEDNNKRLGIVTQAGIVYWQNGQITLAPESNAYRKRRVHYSKSGAVLVFDQDGLRRFQNGSWRNFSIPLPDNNGGARNSRFDEDREGSVWFSANQIGLYRIRGDEATLFSANLGLTPDIKVWAFCQDRAGNLWFSADRLIQYRPDGSFAHFAVDETLKNNINCLYEDREGTLWIGTTNHGLMRLTKQFIITYSAAQGVGDGNIYPIHEDSAGTIWIGSRYLTALRRQPGIAIGEFFNYPKETLPSSFQVRALTTDYHGELWIGGATGLYSLKDNRIINQSQMLPGVSINAIYEDSQGETWFGSEQGLFKRHGDQITHYTTKDGLPGDDVRVILKDRQGTLWFGTYGGLAKFNGGRIMTMAKEGLKSDRVRAVYEDEDGVFWIGTYDGGLSRLKDGRIVNITTENGLANNGVFRILEDARGNFWMSSNGGIHRVARQQLNEFAEGRSPRVTSLVFGKSDGMLSAECNGGAQLAGIKASDGKLWFPTLDGVAVIDPEAVPFNSQPPPVRIEAVNLDRANVPFQNEVTVRPGQANLEISYTGLSFIHSEQVRFKYKLIGQDHDWVEAGTRRVVYYPYLPPGQYTFMVIAANSDGVWNEQGQSLKITVLPPFYRTWWFLSLSLLAVAGAVLSSVRYRLAQLHRKHEAQIVFSRQLIESQEAERKRIAAELHDSLGQSLLIIKNRAYLGTLQPEDADGAQEQLHEISEATADAIHQVREIAYYLRPSQLDRLGLTTSLEEMLDHVGGSSGILFEVELASLDEMFAPDEEINLYRIVQECLNNIVKHSRATAAEVSVRCEDGFVNLTIRDNGQGFSPQAATQTAHNPRSGGFGLTGIAERARMLGGEYDIHSAPGQGTKVQVQIPIKGINNAEH